MRTFKKIRANFDSLADVFLFLRIFSLATVLPLLVKILSLPGLMELITPRNTAPGTTSSLDGTSGKIEKYTLYILSRDFWIYRNICLKRSLILYHFLRKYGINVSVCFGVKYKKDLSGMEEKKMEGHAWLIYKGEIYLEINPEETKTYKVTYSFPVIKNSTKEEGFIAGIEELK